MIDPNDYIGQSIVVHTPHGAPMFTIDWPWDTNTLNHLEGENYSYVINPPVPINQIWIDGVNVIERVPMPVIAVLSKADILTDGEDEALVSNLPLDALVRIDGQVLTPNQNGEISITASQPGSYQVEFVGKYYAASVVVKAASLDTFKEEKWGAVKNLRDEKIASGCNVPGLGVFDTDAVSRSNINGAVTGAMMAKAAAAPFSIGWKLAGNGVIQLDADEMLYVGQTVLGYVSACHGNSQTLGVAIQTASDKATLDAIDINSGWLA